MQMDEGLDTGDVAMIERLPIGAGHDRGRAARRAGAARRRPDGARARRAGARHAAVHAAAGRRRHLRRQDRQGRDADRLGQAVAARCTTISAGCRRFPAPGSRCVDGEPRVSRCCATTQAEGAGAPGTAARRSSHHRLRRRRGAHRSKLQRAGKQPMKADEFLRGIDRVPAARIAAKLIAMPRYKLIIEYDGAPFCRLAVPGQCADRCSARCGRDRGVLRRAGPRAGRGPHRCRRACARPGRAFRSRQATRADTVRDALNAHLRPHPVGVLSAEKVPRRFRRALLGDAAALSLSHRQPPRRSRARRGRAWRRAAPLDAEAMHAAAQRLVGKHDFTTFRSTECQAKSPEKTLDRLDVVARRRRHRHRRPSARSFLHNQVRSMVGSLVRSATANGAPTISPRARRARPRRLRAGRAAGGALSGAGGLLG